MPRNRTALLDDEDVPVIDTVDLIEAADISDAEGCAMCGGELHLLGTLGTSTWCRCRQCGHEQTVNEEG